MRLVSSPPTGDRTPLITEAPAGAPPFPVAAVVEEDDSYHVLSAKPVFRPVDDNPIRVMADAHDAEPDPPGSVVIRRGTPLRMLAVVHRLDERPTWRERWAARAYRGVLLEAERRGLRAIALPLLATVHGTLGLARSRQLLDDAIRGLGPRTLERIWLVVSRASPTPAAGR
jgi:hypothetical protein